MPNFITQFLALLLFQNYLNTLASASTNDSLSYSNLQKDCQDLFFNVTIETTTNKNISLSNVSLQPQLNQFIQDAISTNVIESAIVGSFNVSGTFTIGATLCDPKGQKPTTIEHLTHGIPHDRTYWDLLIGNLSWVDVALAYGYSTLAIDRLGVGQSEMPDGLNIVQTGVNIEIANSINNMLRAGQIGNREFSKIINVGHSYGSYITNGLGVFHPSSADAFVLTGFGHAKGNTPALLMAWDSVPAHLSQTNPALRSAPSSHYAAPMGLNSLTQSYFHYPQYITSAVDFFVNHRAPITTGELFTFTEYGLNILTSFKGPVLITTGAYDIPFCNGQCATLMNYTSESAYYPSSSNFSLSIVEGSGHAINGHYMANTVYHQVHDFLKSNGF